MRRIPIAWLISFAGLSLAEPQPARALEVTPPEGADTPCGARLQLRSIVIELLSDWAVLNVEAQLALSCERGNPPDDDVRGYQADLWPESAAMWGFAAKDGATSVVASILERKTGEERFASGQSGLPNSRGHILAFDSVKTVPVVSVRPLASSERVTIAYNALLPTVYKKGLHHFEFPELPSGPAPRVVVRFPRGGELVSPVGSGPIGSILQTQGKPREITWRSNTVGVEAELIGVRKRKGGYLLGWRIRASSVLESPPPNAHLVVVIDTSRSLTALDLDAAAAAARAWIHAHVEPLVAIVLVDRSARPQGKGFRPASEAVQLLEHVSRERHDGSAVELGLVAASQLLRAETGPKRVLLLTDGFLDESVTEASLNESFPDVGQSLVIGYLGQYDHDVWSEKSVLNRLANRRGGYFGKGNEDCARRGLAAPLDVKLLSVGAITGDGCNKGRVLQEFLGAGDALTEDLLILRTTPVLAKERVRMRIGAKQISIEASVDPLLSFYERAWAGQDLCSKALGAEGVSVPRDVLDGDIHFISLPGTVAPWANMPAENRGFAFVCSEQNGCADGPDMDWCSFGPSGPATDDLDPDHVQRLLGKQWEAIARSCGASEAWVELSIAGDELGDRRRIGSKPEAPSVARCLARGARALTLPDGSREGYKVTGVVRYPGPILGPWHNPKKKDYRPQF